jgi:hypothetical protein
MFWWKNGSYTVTVKMESRRVVVLSKLLNLKHFLVIFHNFVKLKPRPLLRDQKCHVE